MFPATSTWPAAGRSWPPIRRSNVDLPHPLTPRMPTTLPRGTSSVSPLRTGRASYEKRRSRTSTRLERVFGSCISFLRCARLEVNALHQVRKRDLIGRRFDFLARLGVLGLGRVGVREHTEGGVH